MSNRRNTALFVLLAAIWGSAYIGIKTGLSVLPPVLFAALRYDIASLVLVAYAATAGHRLRPKTRGDWAYIAVGGVLVVGLHFAFLFAGQQYVTPAVASVVLSLTPVLTPLFALALLSDERLPKHGVFGIALGLLGVGIVANPDPTALGAQAQGVGLLLCAAGAFALGTVLIRRIDTTTLPTASGQGWSMLVGAGVLHAISFALPTESLGSLAAVPTVAPALVYLAVVCSAGGFLVYFELVDNVGPNEATLVNYVVPLFAALFGLAFRGDPITPTAVAGFSVVLAGVALLKWNVYGPFVVGHVKRQVGGPRVRRAPDGVVVNGNVYLESDV